MPNYLVLEFYLLLLLISVDGEGEGWNRLLHGGSVEDEGDDIGVSIFIDMTTWRLWFPDDGIKAEMMSPSWNNFLRSFLRFVVVRSGHDEGLGRIIFRSVFLTLRWQKEEEGRHQKEEVPQFRLQECWPLFVGHLFSGHLPSVCLCGHPYCKAFNRGTMGYEVGLEVASRKGQICFILVAIYCQFARDIYCSNLPGEDIKNLQYAPLLHQVNKRCRFLLEFEKEVQQKLHTVPLVDHPFYGQDVNSSSLGWAMSAASSRAFRLHGEIPMLLPLIDMCNHSFNPNARIVQEGSVNSLDMSVKVVAEKKIEQNAAITLNYGCHPNDFFLLDYGFVITPNPYDQVELSYDGALLDAASMAAGVSSPNFSAPAKWQQDILSQLNLHGEGAILKVSLGGPDIVDGRLLAALRVLLADDPEAVHKHDLKTLMSLDVQAPLGPAVEASALRTVLALCAIALQHFHTKIMDDEAILRGGPPLTTELAVQFRLQKKFMIVDVMQNISRRIKMLSPQKSTA